MRNRYVSMLKFGRAAWGEGRLQGRREGRHSHPRPWHERSGHGLRQGPPTGQPRRRQRPRRRLWWRPRRRPRRGRGRGAAAARRLRPRVALREKKKGVFRVFDDINFFLIFRAFFGPFRPFWVVSDSFQTFFIPFTVP